MNKDILALMKLQGDMRVKLLQLGLSDKQAEDAACDFLQNMVDSGVLSTSAFDAFNEFCE
jgi:hypothetical protein